MSQTIEEYRLAEETRIEYLQSQASAKIRLLVNEQRKLVPTPKMNNNGFAVETDETKVLNAATAGIWYLIDDYVEVLRNRMVTVMALMDTKEKLERMQEQVNEQRERAEEAEDLVTELSRML